jgi:glutathionyl-hydroquinone reductase
MPDAIVVALITGACAVISQLVIAKVNNDKLFNELDKRSELTDQKLEAKINQYAAVTDTKLEELTREVRLHNGFAQRMPVVENDVKTIYKRLDRLESHSDDGK